MNATYATDEIPSAAVDHLAATDHLVGIGPLVAGILVVLFLVLAMVYGRRLLYRGDVSRSTPSGPRPARPRGYEQGVEHPEEVPHDGRRRTPHELGDHEHSVARPARTAEDRTRGPDRGAGGRSGRA